MSNINSEVFIDYLGLLDKTQCTGSGLFYNVFLTVLQYIELLYTTQFKPHSDDYHSNTMFVPT